MATSDSPNSSVLRIQVAQGIRQEALDALDQLFPERSPELTDSIDKIRYTSGQRSVVRFIKSLKDS